MAKRLKSAAAEKSRPGVRSTEELMADASKALSSGDYFEAENLSDRALHQAAAAVDFDLMARIVPTLQEARRQRRLQAIEAGKLLIVDSGKPIAETKIKKGCFVVVPPNVGADARRIHEIALEKRKPVITFACEPLTQLGLLPVVVIGPVTIRTRVKPPKGEMTPAWCLEVIEALSVEAIGKVDTARPLFRQIETLLDLLNTLPESEDLHQALSETCHAATREEVEAVRKASEKAAVSAAAAASAASADKDPA